MTTRPTPPCAMAWTLLDYGSDMMVVIHALSDTCPASAVITELASPPSVPEGRASRLSLELHDASGAIRTFVMDEVPERDQGRVVEAPRGSVVIVEEDPSAPGGRRHSYVASIRRIVPPSGGGLP